MNVTLGKMRSLTWCTNCQVKIGEQPKDEIYEIHLKGNFPAKLRCPNENDKQGYRIDWWCQNMYVVPPSDETNSGSLSTPGKMRITRKR